MIHRKTAYLSLLLVVLTGCAVGPDYQRPEMDVPKAWKEAGDWRPAAPQDERTRGPWWTVYGDAKLNALVAQVAVSNQNVRAAQAQFRQASALLDAARAAYFPTLSGNLGETRASAASTGQAVTPEAIRKTDRLSLAASWEADVWGRLRRAAESNEASAQASAADLQAALLSAQAALVQGYIQLRVNDAQQQLLERTLTGYQRSLEITRNRYDAGVVGRVDVAQAEAQLKSAQAQAIELKAQRAQLEHALAVLVGKAPAEFRLEVSADLPSVPEIPLALPSHLLERRPDVAAAERRVMAANAQIGVAQSAFFPALTLSASGGYQNSGFAHLLSVPNRFWSLGPALAMTLFDGGARAAQKDQAVAGYDKTVANYRQAVLSALQEVEDNLSNLRYLKEESAVQQAAALAAAESLRLTNNQYQAGSVSYLNVVTTQATSLSTDRAVLDVTGRRLLAAVALQKALGGDWDGH